MGGRNVSITGGAWNTGAAMARLISGMGAKMIASLNG